MQDLPLRIAFLVRDDPLEPVGGSALRNRQNILACSQFAQILAVCIAPGKRGTVRLGGRIPIKHHGSEHAWLLSDALTARFSAVFRRAYNWVSKPVGEKILARAVRRDLQSFAPHVVIFEEYKCAALASSVTGLSARTVYDAHNVEAMLRSELAGKRRALGRISRSIVRRERQLAGMADQIWTCSETDKTHVVRCLSSSADVRVIPNVVDPARYESAGDESDCTDTRGMPALVFCASFNYRPNQEAVALLIQDIFPKIARALPEARLALVGRCPTAAMIEAARQDPRITVTGFVRDPADYLRGGRICLVPLINGGGTRLKILEAFASGCPVISTRKGAEGLSVTAGEHLLLAETPDEFVAATAQLTQDADLRDRIVRQARDLVIANYSPDVLRPQLEAAIHAILQDR